MNFIIIIVIGTFKLDILVVLFTKKTVLWNIKRIIPFKMHGVYKGYFKVTLRSFKKHDQGFNIHWARIV